MLRLVIALILPGALAAGPPDAPLPGCAALRAGDASLGRAGAACLHSLTESGAAQVSCYWSYSYREGAAREAFESLQALAESCLGGVAQPAPGTAVNHPDSFDQQVYTGRGWRASVSLKDKAGAGRSLVFLSLAQSAP